MELSPDQRRIRDFYFKEALALPADRHWLHAKQRFVPENVFTLADFRRLLNDPFLNPGFLAIFNGGKAVELEDAACYKVVQRRKIPFVDRRVLQRHFEAGAACVLEGLDILEPSINALATSLDRAHRATFSNATVFFSQQGNEAYRGHADTDDVLVIHLGGEKRWRIHNRLAPRRTRLNELTDGEMGPLAEEITMRPGDALYLRSYCPHRVQTLSSWSLHIAFDLCDRTVNVETALDLLLKHFSADAAYPLAATEEVMGKLQALAARPRFAEDIQTLQTQERASHEEFRSLLANNRITALDRFVSESGASSRVAGPASAI